MKAAFAAQTQVAKRPNSSALRSSGTVLFNNKKDLKQPSRIQKSDATLIATIRMLS